MPLARASCSVGKVSLTAFIEGNAIAGGRCVNGGNSDAAALREFWIKTALSKVISFESISGEEPLLHQDERSHGFYDRDSSRNDAWVMAATSGQGA